MSNPDYMHIIHNHSFDLFIKKLYYVQRFFYNQMTIMQINAVYVASDLTRSTGARREDR